MLDHLNEDDVLPDVYFSRNIRYACYWTDFSFMEEYIKLTASLGKKITLIYMVPPLVEPSLYLKRANKIG